MKNIKYLFWLNITILAYSCASKNDIRRPCQENLAFKKVFYENIVKVDNRMEGKPIADYKEALKFLSKYAHVSFDSMLNYANIYDSQEIYKQDREGWIKWYEENKCSNIQFK